MLKYDIKHTEVINWCPDAINENHLRGKNRSETKKGWTSISANRQ